MRNTALVTVALLLCTSALFAEQRSWVYQYESPGDIEWANSVVYANGRVYAAGEIGSPGAHDILVVCLTAGGQKLWEYVYTKPVDAEDQAYAIVFGDDGNVYVAGTSYGYDPGPPPTQTGPDFFVLSLTSGGQYRWEYRKSQATAWNRPEVANSLVYANDGVYATGYLDYGNTDIWTVKLNLANGLPIWERRWYAPGNTGGEAGNGIVCGAGNAVYVAGLSTGQTTARDFTVLRLRADNGSVDWDYIYPVVGASEEVATSIAYGQDGNIYAAGKVGADFFALSLDPSENKRWEDTYSCPDADEARAIVYGPDNNVYVAGRTSGSMQNAFAVVSYHSTLQNPQRRWVYEHFGTNSRAFSIRCGYDSNVYAAGLTSSGEQGYFTVVSLPYGSGTPNWVHQYDPTQYLDYHEARAIDCGLDGFIYSAGRVQTGGDDEFASFDVAVVCINPTDHVAPGSTEPSSGRHLVRELGTMSNFHAAYYNNDNVFHTFSGNGGNDWSAPDWVDQGKYPSVGTGGPVGQENQGACVAYLNGDQLRYRCFNILTQSWQGFTIYPTVGSEARVIGPASLYVTGDFVHVVYPVEDAGQYRIQYNCFGWGAINPGNPQVIETYGAELKSPCIECDGNWVPHVIYEKDSRLRYAFKEPMSGWNFNYQIRNEPGFSSTQPFIESWGDRLCAPWSANIGMMVPETDIFYSMRQVYAGLWDAVPARVTQTTLESESPVCELMGTLPPDPPRALVTYSEFNSNTATFDIQYRLMPSPPQYIEETSVRSYWAHNHLAYDWLGQWRSYNLWTEGDAPGNYYVRFSSLTPSFFKGGEPAYYTVECGQERASHFCLSRSGIMKVNNYAIDYGGDSLVYNLHLLDPRYDYTARILCTHGGSSSWDLNVVADGRALLNVRVPPAKLETLSVKIPLALYEKDHAIRFSLKRQSGFYAPCQSITFYQRERQRKGGEGGCQTSGISSANPGFRVRLSPNPSYQSTVISYGLDTECLVMLRVFDVTGRMVGKLYDGKQSSGVHAHVWDNRDQSGRQLTTGVYFVKIEAGNIRETRKLVIAK